MRGVTQVTRNVIRDVAREVTREIMLQESDVEGPCGVDEQLVVVLAIHKLDRCLVVVMLHLKLCCFCMKFY